MSNKGFPIFREFQADSSVVISRAKTLSQSEVLSKALQLSTLLDECEYLIHLCSDRANLLLGFIAALHGAVKNVMPPNVQLDTLKGFAERYPAHLFLVDSDKFHHLENCIDIRSLDLGTSKNTVCLQVNTLSAEQLAVIAFTSGSTGAPKENDKIWATLSGTAQKLSLRFSQSLDRRPCVLATVPSQHMYGLELTAMMALQGGWRLYSAHPFFPQDIADCLQDMPSPRVLVTTPVHLRALTKSGIPLPPLDLIISATSPLDLALAEQVEHLYATQLLEIYGCTEGGSLATRRTVKTPAWTPLEGVMIHKRESGFFVSADHLPIEAKLNDRLELSETNEFILLGRDDDMLNVGGKRASIADLNRRLLAIDGVMDGVIFIGDTVNGEARPAALYVSDELREPELLKKLSQQIDSVFLPRPIKRVHSLARNTTGKVPLKTLKALMKGEQSL